MEPLSPEHAESLLECFREDDGSMWTYLTSGPFADIANLSTWIDKASTTTDPLHYAVVAGERALGTIAYLRIAPEHGSIEVGHVTYPPRLRRTRPATEAVYLLMRHAFESGYRRFEWKCDALNAPSRQAARRYGLTFEGIFRNGHIINGRSRDTAWYAVIDRDWPQLGSVFERWLNPANFSADGSQRHALSGWTQSLLQTDHLHEQR